MFWLKWLYPALIVLMAAASQPANAANKCTKNQKKAANLALQLSTAEQAQSLTHNLFADPPKSTLPVITGEHLLVQKDYVINYDDDLRVPLWTSERIVSSKLDKVKRSDCFRADPRLSPSQASDPDDYDEAVFDQGHMTPAADMTSSRLAMHNSFLMSNMTPQTCQFNRGVWQMLEAIVRQWAKESDTLWVMNGAIFDRNHDGRRDGDFEASRMISRQLNPRVGIPTAFYKIIHRRSVLGGPVEVMVILLPHNQEDIDPEDVNAYLQEHIVPVATVAREAALDIKLGATTQATQLWSYPNKVQTLARGAQCRQTAGMYH